MMVLLVQSRSVWQKNASLKANDNHILTTIDLFNWAAKIYIYVSSDEIKQNLEEHYSLAKTETVLGT